MYAWNDSVLLFAYLRDVSDYEAILREADKLKCELDSRFGLSYGIAVKGKAFPSVESTRPSVIVIESSWALANCFQIEKEARRRRWRYAWYIDSRIAMKIKTATNSRTEKVELLPNDKNRAIHLYDTYLWNGILPTRPTRT